MFLGVAVSHGVVRKWRHAPRGRRRFTLLWRRAT